MLCCPVDGVMFSNQRLWCSSCKVLNSEFLQQKYCQMLALKMPLIGYEERIDSVYNLQFSAHTE